MKQRLWIALVLLMLLALSGCETFRGFGRDMQRAGRSIERHADH